MECDIKSMTDNVKSIRKMSEALTDAAGNGEFQEKLKVELTELISAFDDVAKRSQVQKERLLSAQENVETLLTDIRQVDSGIDELMTKHSKLDLTSADPASVSELRAEFKVTFWNVLL